MPLWHSTDSSPLYLALGQCRLDYISATVVQLKRYNGYLLTIDGAEQVIPAAGVNLSNAGIGAGVFRYVYAYMNAGVMTLEASATGSAVDERNGLEIKSGDGTRTLVGYVYTDGSGNFVSGLSLRGVRSYYNRISAMLRGTVSGAQTGSTVAVALIVQSSAIFVAGDVANLEWNGRASNSVAGAHVSVDLRSDSGSLAADQNATSCTAANVPYNTSVSVSYVLAPGLHGFAVWGFVNTGVGTWTGYLNTAVWV